MQGKYRQLFEKPISPPSHFFIFMWCFLSLFSWTLSSEVLQYFVHAVCLQADMSVEVMRQNFQESSLEYVCKLQEIQERKKFECVEPVSAWPFVQIVIQLDSFQHCLLSCLPVDSIWYALTYHKKERKHIYWNSLSMQHQQNKTNK